jgi:hypothetical protein
MLRSWVFDIGSSLEAIEDVAGLPTRYTASLLAGDPAKSLGRSSMGAILGALGLRLIVAVDEPALQKIRHRLTPSKWTKTRLAEFRGIAAAASQNARTDSDAGLCGKHHFAGNSEWGRNPHAVRLAGMSQEARSRQARNAVNARCEAARRRIRERQLREDE